MPIPEELNHLASLEWDNYISYVEIENLLPSKFLTDNSLVTKKSSPAGDYLKIREDKKTKIWPLLFDLSNEDFDNFKPLFEKIINLFNLK